MEYMFDKEIALDSLQKVMAILLVTGTGAWVYPDACPRDYVLEKEN